MQDEEFVEILKSINAYKRSLKAFASRSLHLQGSIAQQQSLLEDENRKLAKINRNIGLFLINNPLASDLTFDEREKVILSKNGHETKIYTETDELHNIKEGVKNLTNEFSKKLLSLINGSDETENRYDESSIDEYEKQSFQKPFELSLKRVHETSEDEEDPMIKQPKLEVTDHFNDESKSKRKDGRCKYIYKYGEIECKSNMPPLKLIRDALQPMKFASITGDLLNCKNCNTNFKNKMGDSGAPRSLHSSLAKGFAFSRRAPL